MLANITMSLISSGNIDKIKMAFLLFKGHHWSLYKSLYVGSVSLNTNPNTPSPLTYQWIYQGKTSAPQ